MALGGDQGRPQGDLQIEFLLHPHWGLGKRRQEFQAHSKVPEGFQVGRALEGLLSGTVPIGNGLRQPIGLRIVMGQQLGLHGAELGKPRRHRLGHTLMVLLASTPEQGLRSSLLDQGMLKDVRRLRWQPLLVQELCLHQLVQPTLHGRLVPRGDGLQRS